MRDDADRGAHIPQALAGGAARRRARLLAAATAALSLLGVADALYLTVEHLSGRSVRCMVVSGCDEVLASRYATVAGAVPLAALGVLAYFTVFSLATLIAFGYERLRAPLLLLVVMMLAASLWLVYLQAFVIKAFCFYCLFSATLTTVLTFLVVAGWKTRPGASLS